MKQFAYLAIIFGLIAVTTQDITRKKGCDCRICQEVENQIDSLVGKKPPEEPGCSLCERKKELLRQERERQKKLQKCPFELLGSPAIKGKTSEEIFDEFRELIVPSQNSFFDMMRGIVKTMHVSSVAELKWAKEKEARELALRKAEEAKKRKEAKKEEIKEEKPESPKVTVVLKQKPCSQFIALNRDALLSKRFPKEAENVFQEKELVSDLQLLETMTNGQYLQGDSENEDLMRRLFSVETYTEGAPETGMEYPQESETEYPQESVTELSEEIQKEFPQEAQTENLLKSQTEQQESVAEGGENFFSLPLDMVSTESPFVKFMTNEEYKAQLEREGTPDIDFFNRDLKLEDGGMNNELSTVSSKYNY